MIRLLIVGVGAMAHTHAQAFSAMAGVQIVAAVDPDTDALAQFRQDYEIPHGFSDVDAAIKWDAFDAATNVTPDAIHHRTTLPLLAAGKHVLCEKPLATSHADALEMATAAQAAGVVNMVNLTYRNVPALMQAAKLVSDGAIGAIRHFEASYLQSWLTQDQWGDWRTEDAWLWRLSRQHGSLGVLGDVGVHIVDFASFAAGSDIAQISCRLQTFDKAAGGQIGPYTLDANDSVTMQASLQNGAIGVIHASRFASGHINDLRVRLFGTKGGIVVRYESGQSGLSLCHGPDLRQARWTEVATAPVTPNFDRFIAAIKQGVPVAPDFARGAALQKILDCAVASDAQAARSLSV